MKKRRLVHGKQIISQYTPRQKKEIHVKIFITIIMSLCISILVLSLVLNTYFEQVLLDKTFESERNNLFQAEVSLRLMKELSRNIAVQIFNDYSLSGLLYVPEQDQVELIRSLNALKKYQNLISYIHSIYIYNPISDTYYISSPASTSMIQPGLTFYDREVKELIEQQDNVNLTVPLPRIIKEPEMMQGYSVDQGVYTFVFNLFGIQSRQKTSIIINVSEAWLRNIIDSLDVNPKNRAFIIDRNDNMLISSGNTKILSRASIYQSIKGTLDSGNKSGYTVLRTEGRDYFIVFSLVPAYDWIIVKQIPYDSLMGYIVDIRKNLVLISVVILLLGVVYSIILMQRLMRPIDSILDDLRILEKKQKTDSSVLKQYSLKQLLEQSSILNDFELKRITDELSIDFAAGNNLGLVLLEIDRFDSFLKNYTAEEQHLLKLGTLDAAQVILAESFPAEGMVLDYNHVVLLLNSGECGLQEYRKSMNDLALKIQDGLKKSLALSVSITVSPEVSLAGDVSSIFPAVMKESRRKYFIGNQAIIIMESDMAENAPSYIYPIEKVEALIQSVNSGDFNAALEKYNGIVTDAAGHGYERVRAAIDDIAHRIAKIVQSVRNCSDVLTGFDLDEFLTDIMNAESLADANARFKALLAQLSEAIDSRKKGKKYSLINAVIEKIESEYSDRNLSIATLAAQYHVSAAYLGRLFLESMGKSMPEYVNHLRIEVAKQLLCEDDTPISEIMEKAGFSNKTHFYSMFKKYNGVAPSEYRLQNRLSVKNGVN